jgi:hypothetical protein
MMKKVLIVLVGTLFAAACSDSYSPSNPAPTSPMDSSPSSTEGTGSNGTATPGASTPTALGHGPHRVGFGFNATVSGFPAGKVFLTGGGSFDHSAGQAEGHGGFRCLESVLQGPLSVSINPNDPGPCLAGQGVRWDTASLLDNTGFKCTGAATETLKTAVTGDHVVVLQADFYRASNGNDESFTGKIIVSDRDIAPDFPGANVWVQNVGCGAAQSVNFSK